jgi:hypothetical protein
MMQLKGGVFSHVHVSVRQTASVEVQHQSAGRQAMHDGTGCL